MTRCAAMPPSSSMTFSQPRRLPSTTGIWVRKTRSPANKVPVFSSSTVRSLSLCAVGHARSANLLRPKQILVADKIGSLSQECRIAKDMIRVTVRVDDVSDWLFGAGANGREQLSSFAHAAAGIDHRNRFVADDETDIGSRALILTCHQRGQAMVHERSGCDFADRRRALPRLRERERAE